MQYPELKGILTVVTTPFNAADEIDFDVLGQHVEFLLANGVHCLLSGGTTGEYYALSVEERKQVLKFVAERVAGRAQLIAGTNSVRPAETIELTNYAQSLGYEAVMLAAPYYCLPDAAELAEHFRYIAAHTQLPIMLYNFPARTGIDMSKDFLEAVSSINAIFAIKESSGSIGRMYEHMVSFGQRYERVCGADDQALDYFLWGSKSFVAGASNFLPAEHVALYEACVARKDFAKGREIMDALMPLFYLLENGGKYLQYVKYGCQLAGIPVGEVRRPLRGLSDEQKASFRRLYENVKSAAVFR